MVPPASVSSPDELKNKTVCEGQELKLHCHESKFLNIYSATYGRKTQEGDTCAPEAQRLPPFGAWCSVCSQLGLSERIRAWVPGEGRHSSGQHLGKSSSS